MALLSYFKLENRTEVILKFSRFLRHRRPGINEGVFGSTYAMKILLGVSNLNFTQSADPRGHPELKQK